MPEMIKEAKKTAIKLSENTFSVEFDMLNGWKPRPDMKNPFPLIIEDELSHFLEKKQDWIYRGFTPSNTYELHAELSGDHSYTVSGNNLKFYKQLLKQDILKNRAHIMPKHRPSVFQPQVEFDSCFESGNLAYCFRSEERAFVLFLRIDTNTKGHTQWFNFGVRSDDDMVATFTIMNMSKSNSIFANGGKPVWSTGDDNWQPVEQASYRKVSGIDRARWFPSEEYRQVSSLKFSFALKKHQKVFFAYSVPYTFGHLQRRLQVYKQFCKVESLCSSASGLDVPLLKFPCRKGNNSPVIFVTGRIHPGEASSSHMVEGMIDFLCSSSIEANYLLDAVEVRVVPMINVDGVVCGNFRTGLSGDDLNRRYLKTNPLLHSVINAVKQQVSEIQSSKNRKVFAFLDLHGHSTKPNIFTYGPDIETTNKHFIASRYYVKQLSSLLSYFRADQCSWKVPPYKRSTARWVMLHKFGINLVFTVEASTAARTSAFGSLVHFSPSDYRQSGQCLMRAMATVFRLLAGEIKVAPSDIASFMAGVEEAGRSDSEDDIEDFQGMEKMFIQKKMENIVNYDKRKITKGIKKLVTPRKATKTKKKNNEILKASRLGKSEDIYQKRDITLDLLSPTRKPTRATFTSVSAAQSKLAENPQHVKLELVGRKCSIVKGRVEIVPTKRNKQLEPKSVNRLAMINQAILARLIRNKESKTEEAKRAPYSTNLKSQQLSSKFSSHLHENYFPKHSKLPSMKSFDQDNLQTVQELRNKMSRFRTLDSQKNVKETAKSQLAMQEKASLDHNILLSQVAFKFDKSETRCPEKKAVVSKKVLLCSGFPSWSKR